MFTQNMFIQNKNIVSNQYISSTDCTYTNIVFDFVKRWIVQGFKIYKVGGVRNEHKLSFLS